MGSHVDGGWTLPQPQPQPAGASYLAPATSAPEPPSSSRQRDAEALGHAYDLLPSTDVDAEFPYLAPAPGFSAVDALVQQLLEEAQALVGSRQVGATPTRVPWPTQATGPSLDAQLAEARAATDPGWRSKLYDDVADRLEAMPEAEVDGDLLEEAQQGAKREREHHMRWEAEQTATGRELVEFERRSGLGIVIKTDREWAHDAEPGIANAQADGIHVSSRAANGDVYVHEFTHEVDRLTGIIAEVGDDRSREQVVAEATAKYVEYGLDPSSVPAVVDATYHRDASEVTLGHGHTRLAEARHHRELAGGAPLTGAEVRRVLQLGVPREISIAQATHLREHPDDAAALERIRAASNGRGQTVEDALAYLDEDAARRESGIVAIEEGRARRLPGPDRALAPA